MAKSKTDPSRKSKVEKYKQSKMSKEKDFQNLRQVPTWNSEEQFTLNGAELENLYNFFNIFAPVFTSVQSIFGRGIKDGKIQLVYETADGKKASDEDIKAYTEKLNAFFKQKMEEDKKKSEASDIANEAYGEMENNKEAKIIQLS